MERYERNLVSIVQHGREIAALAEELMRRQEEDLMRMGGGTPEVEVDAPIIHFINATADYLEASAVRMNGIISGDNS